MAIIQWRNDFLWWQFFYNSWIVRADKYHPRRVWLPVVLHSVSIPNHACSLFRIFMKKINFFPKKYLYLFIFWKTKKSISCLLSQCQDWFQWRIFEKWKVSCAHSLIGWSCFACFHQWSTVRWAACSFRYMNIKFLGIHSLRNKIVEKQCLAMDLKKCFTLGLFLDQTSFKKVDICFF